VGAPPLSRVDPETTATLRAGETVLADNLWSAIIGDASMVRDPALAGLAISLGQRISQWALARSKGEPLSTVSLEEVEPLLRSRLVYSIIGGARSARHVASMTPNGATQLCALFKAVPVRARRLMTLYSVPLEPAAAEQFVEQGLSDPARSVREWSANAAAAADLTNLVRLVKEAVAREPDPRRAGYMQRCESHLERGYWLGPVDGTGLRECQVILREPSGTCWVGIYVPAAAFESLGESEVAARTRRSYAQPPSKPDLEWLEAELERWRRERGLPAA
jgi:hypothetical protein